MRERKSQKLITQKVLRFLLALKPLVGHLCAIENTSKSALGRLVIACYVGLETIIAKMQLMAKRTN